MDSVSNPNTPSGQGRRRGASVAAAAGSGGAQDYGSHNRGHYDHHAGTPNGSKNGQYRHHNGTHAQQNQKRGQHRGSGRGNGKGKGRGGGTKTAKDSTPAQGWPISANHQGRDLERETEEELLGGIDHGYGMKTELGQTGASAYNHSYGPAKTQRLGYSQHFEAPKPPAPKNPKHEPMPVDITPDKVLLVAERLELEYLSPADIFPASFPVSGVIHGLNKRLMINLVCCRPGKSAQPINVVFLVNTTAPVTYLSERAMRALAGNSSSSVNQSLEVRIQSNTVIECQLSPSRDNRLKDLNVLGMDFMADNQLSLRLNYRTKTFKLVASKK
ncbi:hypothetical protein HDU96_005202 [Phlyctochytrium bullatum]|nr:hypothetical protein HDU96_005202 [Phlyctochytrium bullatum]